MRHSLSASRRVPRLALCLLTTLSACRDGASAAAPAAPPSAEFVLSAGDSSFWVSSARGTINMRRAPLELAAADGRFYELYVADDDRSYESAVLVGQMVFRRDLVTGDSIMLYQDTVVSRLARLYGRLHPDDEPLRPTEEPSEDPRWTATSSLALDEVAGPFVSYSLHTDVERDDVAPWHTSRRGVLDIRTGRPATLAAVTGTAQGDVERARARVFQSTLDSVRASQDERGERAAAMLPFYRLDPASFSVTTLDGAPAVAYAIPGAGAGDAGHLLALAPIPIGEPAWWPAAMATLPVSSADGGRDVWRRGAYEVVVRYDARSGAALLALRDSTSREWALGRIPAPATRILWLDRPPLDSLWRRALDRAFEESSLYDETIRTAAYRARPRHRGAVQVRLPHRTPRVAPRRPARGGRA
ncbi:MAG: hypothetical protein LH467_03270 [Gemmatimonadaceae bacterium]|nr:hypothetical protein [Gemmatimonadaceae bacterium]